MHIENVRFILLDIEGTTTDIHFVHQVLFPYSAERLAVFVQKHINQPEVRHALEQVKATVQDEASDEERRDISDQEVIQTLLRWIQMDRKHGALKALQGMIWKEGFETGVYQGHVYKDVPGCLKQWTQQGLGLGIYSSGSVQAQKLLFGHSVAGDLTPYFSHYFDTQVGGKKEVASYQNIAKQLQLPPEHILFLSDVEAELDAAFEAGFQVVQSLRDHQPATGKHPAVTQFNQIQVTAVPVT